jgi:hypothetical protein
MGCLRANPSLAGTTSEQTPHLLLVPLHYLSMLFNPPAAAAACRGGAGQQGLEGGSAGQAGRASTHLSLRESQVP